MTVEIKKLNLKNRIALLNSRTGKENGKIVRKLERQLRNLNKNQGVQMYSRFCIKRHLLKRY